MSELKRIDPASVPAMFQRLGLKPIRHDSALYAMMMEGRRECCVGGAKAVEHSGFNAYESLPGGQFVSPSIRIAKALSLSHDYVLALMNGWDGMVCTTTGPNARAGLADGRAAWQACVDAGLVGPPS